MKVSYGGRREGGKKEREEGKGRRKGKKGREMKGKEGRGSYTLE